MKTLSYFLYLFLITSLFCSCQKEFDPTASNSNNVPHGTFKAVINGQPWQASSDKQGAIIIGGTINISGISSDGQLITISTLDDVIGEYDLSNGGDGGLGYGHNPGGTTIEATFTSWSAEDEEFSNGTLTITSIDTVHKTIAGTFEGKVLRYTDSATKVITQGAFNVTYTTTISPLPNTKDNNLSATIDGTNWSATNVTGMTQMGSLIINGTTNTVSKTIGFQLPPDIKAGTYTLNFGSGYNALYNEMPGDATTLKSFVGDGTLVISEHDVSKKLIKGTFNFTGSMLMGGSDTRNITNGSFSVTY